MIRQRPVQAVRLHPLKPSPTRLRQRRRATWYLEAGNLVGGVWLVLVAAYLLWRVVP